MPECSVCDIGLTVWNRNARKIGVEIECKFPNTGETTGKCHTAKAIAFPEGPSQHVGDPIAQSGVGQVRAGKERRIADSADGPGNRDGTEVRIFSKRAATYDADVQSVDLRRNRHNPRRPRVVIYRQGAVSICAVSVGTAISVRDISVLALNLLSANQQHQA